MSELMVLVSSTDFTKHVVYPYAKNSFLGAEEKKVLKTVIEMLSGDQDRTKPYSRYNYVCNALTSADPRILAHPTHAVMVVRDYIKTLLHINVGVGDKVYSDLDDLRHDHQLFQQMSNNKDFLLEDRIVTRICWLEYLINHG